MKFLKNWSGIFGKILFTKPSSKIVLKFQAWNLYKRFKENFEKFLEWFEELSWKFVKNLRKRENFWKKFERFVGNRYWTNFLHNWKFSIIDV